MKRYSFATIIKMSRHAEGFNVYKPFPGKIPSRIYVHIWVSSELTLRKRTVYFYNGKWSYAALRSAERALRKLQRSLSNDPNSYANVSVYEYSQTCLLYTGNLSDGIFYAAHSLAHFESPCKGRRNRTSALFVVNREVPLQLGKKSVLVSKTSWDEARATPETANEFRRNLMKNFRLLEAA